MKRINRLSLRLRLTLVIALILIAASTVLMAVSIYSARSIYADVPFPIEVADDEIRSGRLRIPAGELPGAVRVEQNNKFRGISLLSLVLVVAAGTGLTYLLAGRALKPVRDLAREIGEIDEHNLFRPVRVMPSNDEVSRLSVSFNHMIAKLDKAFSSQKNFSANAAHELKTPLAAMIANIEVLQLDDRPTLEEYKETMDDTLENARRLCVLVQDLLKMNAEPNPAAYEKIAAQALFGQILREFAAEVDRKRLRIEIKPGDALLCGDRPLLHRAFANVVHNAIKYNKPGGTIQIAATEINGNTRITLFDTGIGIPADHLGKIFDPFHCVDPSRSRELGGSGLGLSIVRSVIDKHRGQIQVQSVEGMYTAFVIELPKPI